LQALLNLRE